MAAAAGGVGPGGRRDFHLAFSPSVFDPGRTAFRLLNPQVPGWSDGDVRRARRRALYGRVCDHIVAVLESRGGGADQAALTIFAR